MFTVDPDWTDRLFFWALGVCWGYAFSPLIRRGERWLVRKIRCRLGHCPCRLVDTEYGMSGMCVDCGKVIGFMSSQRLREVLSKREAERNE